MAKPIGLKIYTVRAEMTDAEISEKIGRSRQTVNTALNSVSYWRKIETLIDILLACGLTMETIRDVPLGDLFDFGTWDEMPEMTHG